ncbi:MAG: hypothetical protein KME21_10825 [Desmonostoc vinosum HA7617-LM4]|jgi:hypothetical protein|nr:hypothetical protein [Desmonostoc vinosum HA7617-LM4]
MFVVNIQIFKNPFCVALLSLLIASCNASTDEKNIKTATPISNVQASKTVESSPVTSETKDQNTNEEIKAVFDENLRGLNEENLEVAMTAIEKNSSVYEQTRQLTQKLFDTYDLKYEINNFEVIEVSQNSAKVRITQTTKKVSGPAFRDNILVAINTLNKSDGKWKVLSTEVESVKYLN